MVVAAVMLVIEEEETVGWWRFWWHTSDLCVLFLVQINFVVPTFSCAVGIVKIKRRWSDDTSAPLITYRHGLLSWQLLQMTVVNRSGDLHMPLGICLYGKMLPPITIWFRPLRSAKRSPFLSICPRQCILMVRQLWDVVSGLHLQCTGFHPLYVQYTTAVAYTS